MDFRKGEIVNAINGKDKDKLFIVLDIRENFVLIADGKSRKLEKPKLKNKKHLQKTEQEVDASAYTTNKKLRYFIVKVAQRLSLQRRQQPCLKTM